MTYEAWRISYQSSEQAARAAYAECARLQAKIEAMERQEPYCWTTSPPSGHYSRFNPEVDRWIENGWTVVPLYLAPGAQPASSFADAYQGAMEEVAIWKKRALEAEDLNRKFVAEINGPTYMGEPAQTAPSVPDSYWKQAVEEIADEGFGAVFKRLISDRAAMLAAAPEAKP